MSALFLTPDELVELTGFKVARYQVRWLDKNRWRYALARHSQPRVSRDYFAERVGSRAHTVVSQVNHAAMLEQPNFDAINRR